MKGKIILKPIEKPVEGMQVVWTKDNSIVVLKCPGSQNDNPFGNKVHSWFITDNCGQAWEIFNSAGNIKIIPELKQIVIEYQQLSGNFNSVGQLPLHPEDWDAALPLIGKEVEFETFEFYPRHKTLKGAKLILPKQEENSWEEIWLNWQRESYTFMGGNQRTDDSDFYDWLKQTYPAPKRLKQ